MALNNQEAGEFAKMVRQQEESAPPYMEESAPPPYREESAPPSALNNQEAGMEESAPPSALNNQEAGMEESAPPLAQSNQEPGEFAKMVTQKSGPTYMQENPLQVESKEVAESRRRKIQETRNRNLPKLSPNRFILQRQVFADMRNPILLEPSFPENTLVWLGKKLTADDIVVFFDDVMMPFRIENNILRVIIPKQPFINMYHKMNLLPLLVPGTEKPSNQSFSVVIYMKDKTGRFIAAFPTREQTKDDVSSINMAPAAKLLENKDPNKYQVQRLGLNLISVKPEWLYAKQIHKSTFRIVSPDNKNAASDSESDHEEGLPKGINSKTRYNIARHYRLPMSVRAQNVLYTILQGYLRGAFTHADQKTRQDEKASRNSWFAASLQYKPEMSEAQKVEQAQQFAVDMLETVGRYYLSKETIFSDGQDRRQNANFREGLLQLLDFSHAFGKQGEKAFTVIFGLAVESGIFKFEDGQTICLHFQRTYRTVEKNRTREDVKNITLSFHRVGNKVELKEQVDADNFAVKPSNPNITDIDQPNYEEDLFKAFSAMKIEDIEDNEESASSSSESKAALEVVSSNQESSSGPSLRRPPPLAFLQQASVTRMNTEGTEAPMFSLDAVKKPNFNGTDNPEATLAETALNQDQDALEEAAESARRDIGHKKVRV